MPGRYRRERGEEQTPAECEHEGAVRCLLPPWCCPGRAFRSSRFRVEVWLGPWSQQQHLPMGRAQVRSDAAAPGAALTGARLHPCSALRPLHVCEAPACRQGSAGAMGRAAPPDRAVALPLQPRSRGFHRCPRAATSSEPQLRIASERWLWQWLCREPFPPALHGDGVGWIHPAQRAGLLPPWSAASSAFNELVSSPSPPLSSCPAPAHGNLSALDSTPK